MIIAAQHEHVRCNGLLGGDNLWPSALAGAVLGVAAVVWGAYLAERAAHGGGGWLGGSR